MVRRSEWLRGTPTPLVCRLNVGMVWAGQIPICLDLQNALSLAYKLRDRFFHQKE